MNILINGLAALKPRTGVGHHLTQLVQHLREVALADEFTLYPGEQLSEQIRRWNTPRQQRLPVGQSDSAWKGRLKQLAKSIAKPLSRWHFAAYTRRWSFDLYHEPNFIPYPSRLPTVITIHDLSVLKFPQWHPADRVKLHGQQLKDAANRAQHVIAVSQAIKQEICTEFGVPPERVSAIHNGIGDAFFPRPRHHVEEVRRQHNLPQRYFLAVGTIEPRKNLSMLMQAFAELPEAMRRDCPLVLAGPFGWNADEERTLFGQIAGVRQLGYVTDDDLPLLYCGATALLYPSHYEGFGMPPTEMLACGGLAVCSDIPVLREVCGDSACYLPTNNLGSWAEMLKKLASGDRPRVAPLDAHRYSWWQNAEQTHEVYRRVLGRSE